jgi:hypothetical protein
VLSPLAFASSLAVELPVETTDRNTARGGFLTRESSDRS